VAVQSDCIIDQVIACLQSQSEPAACPSEMVKCNKAISPILVRNNILRSEESHAVRPCHHGKGCLQVADGGTTFNMEDSCVQIAEKGRSFSLGFGRSVNNSSP